jgi:hypothetical protein
MNVHETTDYAQFNMIVGNRSIKKLHLQKIIKSIDKQNLLDMNPIIVNKELEIIDGQHRLMAAKHLKVPIFYYIRDKFDVESIALLQTQLRWKAEEYIHLYATADGNEHYIKLQDYIEVSGLSSLQAISFLGASIETIPIIKSGVFIYRWDTEAVLKDVAIYKRFLDFLETRRIKPYKQFNKVSFVRSLIRMMRSGGFNEEKFFSKLELRWEQLGTHSSEKEFLRMLLGIYNFGCRTNVLNIDNIYRSITDKVMQRLLPEYMDEELLHNVKTFDKEAKKINLDDSLWDFK